MKTVDFYIDEAKKNRGIKSDAGLSRELGFKGNPTGHWRTKRAWPADETIVELAEMANEDPTEALMNLNIWRASGKARVLYERIAKSTVQSVAILGVSSLATFGFQPKTAEASQILEKVETQVANNVYYGKY
ncbi:hypothetical protein WH96_06625 [Kiloniella spongiae]|uniref:Uncharacterized protein n=1 Tax=Kiloniella spongiae TaxID=1489064 RepID=A0A0H2MGI3_9PROT|nr:hypothetical protein [Kiloniella spongiae]KLN61321.1 hypothetical protein WH96_06625 [Kiloniella spongiae]